MAEAEQVPQPPDVEAEHVPGKPAQPAPEHEEQNLEFPVITPHDWEKLSDFDPYSIPMNSIQWVDHQGNLLSYGAQGMVNNAHITQETMSSVVNGRHLADVSRH